MSLAVVGSVTIQIIMNLKQSDMITIKEKAEAYDKVRKKIAIRFGSNVADDFFAEFEGSKDEEIRKALLEMVHDTTGDELWVDYNVHKEEALTWLENQGQVKESTISQQENRTCEENGNSLTYEDERIRKEIINYFRCQSEEEPTRKEIHNKWIAWLENIPYTIDHEKREGFHLGYKACLEKQGEQKPEENKGNVGGISANWSEEDKDFLYDTLSNLTELKDRYGEGYGNVGKCIEWLKSLRPQNRWKPSEEQMRILDLAIRGGINHGTREETTLVSLYEDLKKLKKEE